MLNNSVSKLNLARVIHYDQLGLSPIADWFNIESECNLPY